MQFVFQKPHSLVKSQYKLRLIIFCQLILIGNFAGAEKINSKDFGRLLTSSDERARMDNILQSKSQLSVDRQITYRGVVNRQGVDWVWLNDQVINPRHDGSIFLRADKTLLVIIDEQSYILKIGQTLIPALRQIQDPISQKNGTVTRN